MKILLSVILLFSLNAWACAYIPRTHKRTPKEKMDNDIKQFDDRRKTIKGKDAPGKLF
ncbi:MAG: hypothetical protein HZA78_07130 [Candidatus Schekmanbacteria bacterium]|nr:hypothetical protein [Candidatus Schekmanbacteria bacterium]